MSKSKAELSITKRLLLDFIKYKTNNNHTFFMGNDKIAAALGLTVNSAKVMVNELSCVKKRNSSPVWLEKTCSIRVYLRANNTNHPTKIIVIFFIYFYWIIISKVVRPKYCIISHIFKPFNF